MWGFVEKKGWDRFLLGVMLHFAAAGHLSGQLIDLGDLSLEAGGGGNIS